MDDNSDSNRSARAVTSSTAYSAEAFFKRQLEATNKEKAQLQERLRHVEEQNKALLKSLFELSCAPPGTSTSRYMPLDIVAALRKFSTSTEAANTAVTGKGSAYRRSGVSDRPPETAPLPMVTHHGLHPHVSAAYTPFRHRADLQGHTSAVYVVQFSQDGRFLVSASFDRSIRLWPVELLLDRRLDDGSTAIIDAHRAPIVAVEWTMDLAHVISGALDQSAAEWDVERAPNEATTRFPCYGLVNCVSMSPAQADVFFVGTARRVVHAFDRRIPPQPATGTSAVVVQNDTAVNTVHVTLDGRRVITGDHGGAIKTWDVRMVASPSNSNSTSTSSLHCTPVNARFNDVRHRPITHIHTSPPLPSEEYGRFMAVNSYDSYLRVYERGTLLFPTDTPSLAPVHALRGVVNTHWPIKSSFFLGADYRPPPRERRRNATASRSVRSEPSATDDTGGVGSVDVGDEGNGNDDGDEDDFFSKSDDAEHDGSSAASDDEDRDDDVENGAIKNTPGATNDNCTVGDAIRNTLILASGSADGLVYVFDVGTRLSRGALLQTLEGHKDRVYAADFHPHEPMLASCSADSDIKIWQAK